MRILIASGIFLPEIGGPATYADKIARDFLALGQQVEVITYSDSNTANLAFDKELPYLVQRIKRTNQILNYWRYFLAILKRANSVDIIYTFDHSSAGLPVMLANFFLRKTCYIRIGGDYLWESYLEKTGQSVTLPEFYEQNLHRKFNNFKFKISRLILAKAQGLIFTTQYQAQIFSKYYNLDTKKIFVISNPIIIADKIERKNINKDIIFAGRFVHKNNIFNLLKAWQQVDDKSYHLHLIGAGPLLPRLSALIKSKNITNINIEDRISPEALRQKLATSYLAILPSLSDISPNTMLDCLSLGLPFISSQEIGFTWLKDKIITFDPKDSQEMAKQINFLLDPVNYETYQIKINQIDYSYTYQQAAQDTLNIFKSSL